MTTNDVPEGISVVPIRKPLKLVSKRINWIMAKQEYLSNPDMSLKDLAKRLGVSSTAVGNRSRKEQWAKDRSIVYAEVGQRATDIQVEKMALIAARHALIGKLAQKKGIEAIKSGKAPIKSAKVALEYMVEGVRIEREAEGLDRRQPQVVNIITQQQGIIGKYAKNE